MSLTTPAPGLLEFASFVAESTGLDFPRERLADLERAVTRAAPELGFADAGACISGLLTSPPDKERLETLASYLTVGETYFFRNKADFDAIENIILPAFAAGKTGEEDVRIWSAGCATGEEPYSIAMLLNKCSPALKGREVSILATDINSRALREAARGVYGEWSFREVPRHIKDIYFTKTRDKKLALLPRIKKMVDFSYLNLVEDSYPSLLTATNAMDLILCRNVLMYFRPDLAEGVLRKFQASLKEGGWLILTPAEGPMTFPVAVQGLKMAQLPGLTVYRKITEQQPVYAPLLPAETPPPVLSGTSVIEVTPPVPPAAPEKRPLEEARVRANQGRLGEAGRLCVKAIEADKLDPLAHYLLGNILMEEGRDSEAARSFRRAIYLAPDHILAHLAFGNLFLRGGKTAQARRNFKSAAALLARHSPEEVLPDSEGMTAGRLMAAARSALTRCADD